jgi:post-segregation antitoxin (ccd killing protein)
MSYKLRQLQQKLARAPTPEAAKPSHTDDFMDAVEQVMEAKSRAAITVAKELQAKAEARCVELQAALDAMVKEHAKEMKELYHRMESAKSVADAARASMDKEHGGVMKSLQGQLSSLRDSLASEQQARARAEAGMGAMEKSHAKMEKLMQKPVAVPAPTVAPRQAPVPMEVAVSRRDGNGRIMALTIKPST